MDHEGDDGALTPIFQGRFARNLSQEHPRQEEAPNKRIAVKELNLSYYIGEALLFTIYIPMMVAQFKFLNSNPVNG